MAETCGGEKGRGLSFQQGKLEKKRGDSSAAGYGKKA